jgi:poly-beta-1,6-N-acetyl-D-glucosamine synthase
VPWARRVKRLLTYAVVTPASNEAQHLRRLGDSLEHQTIPPASWIIVDNGSRDETASVVDELASSRPWVRLVTMPRDTSSARGAPVVRAFHSGLSTLDPKPDMVAKVDADVSMDERYFERLIAAFEADLALGIASGTCFEKQHGEWRQRYGTGANVWGAARLYRWSCLQEILPLEERMGWDGIDVIKANVRGWRTETLLDLPFRHHRVEASRERNRWHAWAIQGETSHYMGYRPSYLLVRALHHARRDRAALAMIWGFCSATFRRASTCPDPGVRDYLRREQRLRELPARWREVEGAGLASSRS